METDLFLNLENISSPRNLAWSNERISVNSSNSFEPTDCRSIRSTKSKIWDSIKRDDQDIKDEILEDVHSIICSFTGDVNSSKSIQSFYEVFDKAWPDTPESSSASVAFCLLDDGLWLDKTDGQPSSGPIRNCSK